MRFLPGVFACALFGFATCGAAPAPSAAAPAGTPPDFPAHLRELTKNMPEGFSCRVEMPFVVVGNQDAKTLESYSRQTLRWAVDNLKKEYFPHDPQTIIDIWLFKDDASYRKYTKLLFGDEPDTPS